MYGKFLKNGWDRYPGIGERTTFVVCPLPDPTKPESSNDGNYRGYQQFARTVDGYWFREYMSYHGDIEPMPDFEEVSGAEFRKLYIAAKKSDDICWFYEEGQFLAGCVER